MNVLSVIGPDVVHRWLVKLISNQSRSKMFRCIVQYLVTAFSEIQKDGGRTFEILHLIWM